MIKHWFTFAVVLLLWTPALGAQARGYEPADYYDLVTVGEVAVSPTGGHVAWVRTTVVEEDNRRHREIWMQRLQDGRPEGDPFRFTSPTDEARSPAWSPDGRMLSFSSRRGDDDNPFWFLRVDGTGGEAFHVEGVEGTPVWSPDGRWIAYVKAADEEGPSSGGPAAREGWIAPNAVSNTLDAERFDGRVVTSIRYKRDGQLQLRPHYSVRPKNQIYVVPA
jgi:dipeptidyl aminopeptidase/acylaminoacyl peptidase